MDKREVYRQLDAIGFQDTTGVRMEIRYLGKELMDNERITGGLSGFIGNNLVLMICTNFRLLIVHRTGLVGADVKELSLPSITAVDSKRGLMYGELFITAGVNKYHVEKIFKSSLMAMVSAIKQSAQAYQHPVSEGTAGDRGGYDGVGGKEDVADSIRKLHALLADNIISQGEFDKAKSKLLSGIK